MGRNKAKFATVENGKKYLVIEGDRYEISGILGSDKSDYWDNKVVLNIACLGDKTLNSLMKKMSYTVELGSNSYELDDTYKTVYGNIKSIDQDSVIKAKKLISNGESTLEKQEAITAQDFEKAAKIRDEEKVLKEEVEKLKSSWKGTGSSSGLVVDEDDIADILADWTHIPAARLKEEEMERLKNRKSKS